MAKVRRNRVAGVAAADGVDILAPLHPPRAPMSDRKATSKRSAKLAKSHGGHDLTAKQEAFAIAIVQGHSQAEAYRMAYDTATMLPATIYRASWELMRHTKITAYISDMMNHINEKQRMQAVGMAGFVSEKLLQMATSDDTPPNVKVAALTALGRSVGMFTDKKEVKTINDDSLPELEQKLRAKMEALRLVSPPQK